MAFPTLGDSSSRRRTRTGISPLTTIDRNGSESSSPGATTPSSPISSEGDHRRSFSLSSLRSNRAFRSMSISNRERDLTPDSIKVSRGHSRRLSKSRPLSSSSPRDSQSRRGSAISISEDHINSISSISSINHRLSFSVADNLSSATASSTTSVDWRSQHIEGAAPLESDTTLLKTKNPFLVVTRDYLVRTKSRSDAIALFPALAPELGKPESQHSASEPHLVIPTSSIISVFIAESTRPSFGFEVWWKGSSGHTCFRSDFFFNLPKERNEQLHHIIRAMRLNQQDELDPIRRCADVEGLLNKIQEVEEPRFADRKLEIFPVVPRGYTRKEYISKMEDATKKPQEGPAFYLVIGTYLCYLVEVQKSKGGEPTCRHKSFGLVTLECLQGDWSLQEERFIMTFREPFKSPVVLELASRYYRQVIRVLSVADRFIKPVWPQMWSAMEIFRVSGLKEPHHLVSREDFGSLRRTLDAYLTGYRCTGGAPVDWEINWKSPFAPEFRLLPPRDGSYTALQLLAVLRALRYNDYFNSLSFRDVDLSILYGLEDKTPRNLNVGYLSRTFATIGGEHIEMLRISAVLHQEFHALAFCSGTIRQIDFTNCTASLASRLGNHDYLPSLQFLTPILSLLRTGNTKCSRLLLGGNALPQFDIDDLAETMKTGTLHALDISYCGLGDMSLKEIVVAPLEEALLPLQTLSISGNPGRVQAYILPELVNNLPDIQHLSLGGSILGDSCVDGPLIPYEILENLPYLEELDISGFKVNEATLEDLERFLHFRNWKIDNGEYASLRKLVLNRCGLSGSQAARLFDAIGENRGLHLCISGNPIEDGIEDLAQVIRESRGPSGLYMEMVEFKDEDNYISLINALAETKYLSLVSLAGTAPTPSSYGKCSPDLVNTLHNFFARNTSIRCLDLSGFCGKLDDGQLTKGFGRSLSGLSENTTMTHLRIRNQNLHDDAGTLGKVLTENKTLMVLDCQDNNLNLTSLRFLVDSMKTNTSIIEFPFSSREKQAIWKNILRGLRRTASTNTGSRPAPGTMSARAEASKKESSKKDKSSSTHNHLNPHAKDKNSLRPEEAMLHKVLDDQFDILNAQLRRNREALEAASGQILDLDSAPTPAGGSISSAAGGRGGGALPADEDAGWPGLDLDLGTGITDLIGTGHLNVPSQSSVLFDGTAASPNNGNAMDGIRQRRPTVRSSTMDQIQAPLPAPYHLHHRVGSFASGPGVDSPTETLEAVSEVETPPPTIDAPQENYYEQKQIIPTIDAPQENYYEQKQIIPTIDAPQENYYEQKQIIPTIEPVTAMQQVEVEYYQKQHTRTQSEEDNAVFRQMMSEFRAAGFAD
ncbi:hypothetical protein QBC43DRAFT_59377 [Cladorrhinum sp. PSN259]|nr:hypothetical protein QBC43DRAFT_59377 [Cladorrhinum sp. PSN259]